MTLAGDANRVCPTHPAHDEDCRICFAVKLVEALARVSRELATEWGLLEAEVEQEIRRRSETNTLRETPLVSQWLSLFSAVADSDTVEQ